MTSLVGRISWSATFVILLLGGLAVLALAVEIACRLIVRIAKWASHALDIWDLVRVVWTTEARIRRGMYKSGLPDYFYIRDTRYYRADIDEIARLEERHRVECRLCGERHDAERRRAAEARES